VLAENLGNGLRASQSEDLQRAQAVLIAFAFAEMLTLAPRGTWDSGHRHTRDGLMTEVLNAAARCATNNDWSSIDFGPAWIDASGSIRCLSTLTTTRLATAASEAYERVSPHA
jgi:hypothetical protein